MRRFSILLAISVVSLSVLAAVDTDTSLVLEPQMEQRYASNLATKFLTNWHYKDTRLDDELSSQIFDGYIDLLDPNKIYFLAGDLAEGSNEVTTAAGTTITIIKTGDSVCIDNVETQSCVTMADGMATNGVYHVVGEVLRAPAPEEEEQPKKKKKKNTGA